MTTRDYNAEYKDGARKYAYRFDAVLRRYIMRALDPFLPPGKALEMGCYTGDMTELIAAAVRRSDGDRGIRGARSGGERAAGAARPVRARARSKRSASPSATTPSS